MRAWVSTDGQQGLTQPLRAWTDGHHKLTKPLVCHHCAQPVRKGAQCFMQMDSVFCSETCRQADEANGSAFERCDRLRINAWPRPMKREASMMRRSTIDISALVLVDEEQEPEPVAKRQRPAAATMVAMLEPEKNAELLEAELDASLQAELDASLQAELEASVQAELEASLQAD